MYDSYDTWGGMDSEIAANMGTGDFLPPDPEDEPDLLTPWGLIYCRDLRTCVLSLVTLWDVKKAVKGTLLWPWHWLGILAAGQIVETPTALFCTDYNRMRAPSILSRRAVA